ncbi:Ankyrin repeat protein [Aspergillus clavatus NRRL 1]|uniref:Ankyrin repeat protein n=1 Tax=Aspergillus clavatus (strain ATCC 1007 / CBS 513.65 / DSM 816 / NCTC 3887 / NRRL 1 / QM 1276 / 107) TaxID=344612 RepID=A1C8M4_ASPCL|nr:Ankyrin repeat protein [Aspergillus clavatus NRRL 1]EAW13661.1 Ankyrin repeat protein [Aspergillus clavatus NRRL 1]
MANLCLKYLQHQEVSAHYKKIENWPFLSYAVQHWGEHVREACAGGDGMIEVRAGQFLKNRLHIKEALKAYASLCSLDSAEWIHEDVGCSGYDINASEPRGKRTPLRYACVQGNVEAVQELLQLNAAVEDVTLADVICGLPLAGTSFISETHNPMGILDALLETEKLSINARLDARASTALMLAIELLDHKIVERLLKVDSIDINAQDSRGCCHPSLMSGIAKKILLLLLDHGADPNLSDYSGRTVLGLAIWHNQVDNANALLQYHRIILHPGLMHLASHRGNRQIIPLLHDAMSEKCRGYSIDAPDKSGLAPLHYAFQSRHPMEVMEILLSLGADPGAPANNHLTPYELAIDLGRDDVVATLACSGRWSLIETAIKAGGSDLNGQRRTDGCTLLHIAASKGSLEIVRMLLQSGQVPPPCTTKDGLTPLHVAKSKGIARLLIEYGFDVDFPDVDGDTPLSVAIQKGDWGLVTYLIEAGAHIYNLRIGVRQQLLNNIKEVRIKAEDVLRPRKHPIGQSTQCKQIPPRPALNARLGPSMSSTVEWSLLLRRYGWLFLLSLALIAVDPRGFYDN